MGPTGVRIKQVPTEKEEFHCSPLGSRILLLWRDRSGVPHCTVAHSQSVWVPRKGGGREGWRERSDDTERIKIRGVASRCTPPLAAQPTREGVDINDRVLASLVVDDDVNAEERHSQCLPQRP